MVNQGLGAWWRTKLPWPSKCIACRSTGHGFAGLCQACTAELPLNTPACERCATSLPGAASGIPLCGACIKRLPHYQAAFCACRYAYPIDHLVRDLKYAATLAHARILGGLLAEQLQLRQAVWPDCFIPVPLSTQRYRERGYNQVIEIGRFVERRTGLHMRTDLVTRVRHTSEQAGLSKRARRSNMRRAFSLRGTPPKRIAILDDVVTTGSTVNELARLLARGGAEHIEVWAVARAGRGADGSMQTG